MHITPGKSTQIDPRPALYSQQTKAPTVVERGPPPIPYHTRPVLAPVATVKARISLETSNQQSGGEGDEHLAGTPSVTRRVTVDAKRTEPVALNRSCPTTAISLDAKLLPAAPSRRLRGKGEVSIRLTEATEMRSVALLDAETTLSLPPREFVKAKGIVASQSSQPPSHLPHSSTTPSSSNDDPVYWVEQSFQRLKFDDQAKTLTHAPKSVATPRSTHGTTAPASSASNAASSSTRTGYALWPSDSEVSEDDQDMNTKKYYVIAQGRRPGIYDAWRDAEPLVTGVKNNLHKSYKGKKKAERMYQKCQERGIVKVRQ
ncbi:hypothetical protein JOM56_011042 [Amanita muscaria]